MKSVLVDTGFIVARLDRSERNHAQCVEVGDSLKGPFVTCEAVIAESCHLLRAFDGAKEAILENVKSGVFQIPFVLSSRAAHVSKLLTKYADVPMDLADACLVDMATQLGTGRILTLDGDFKVYRWGKNRRFDALLQIES